SVAVDMTGGGTLYKYECPASAQNSTDFFQVDAVSRTFGLLQQSNSGFVPDPQWPYLSGPSNNTDASQFPVKFDTNSIHPTPARFTVNPLNGDQIVISSLVGRVFSTENQGRSWSVIANPTD